MVSIPFETDSFPIGTVANGNTNLSVNWDDILWAAVTVGRPNRHYVFRHGDASVYEAIFRWSVIRMALEQSGPHGRRLRRTAAYKTLDPTEKGAVSYFLGMTFCKLFAAKLLDTPWLLHLDVFRPLLNLALAGKSRPDLVGQHNGSGVWHAFECKGRVSKPDSTVKRKAKEQAQRLVSVDGTACSLHIGTIAYFQGDTLNFFWRDPEPTKPKPIGVRLPPDTWRYYYAPIVELMRDRNREWPFNIQSQDLISIENLDLKVGVHHLVAKHLYENNYDSARRIAFEARNELVESGYQPDGLIVKAGESWLEPFDEYPNSEH